MGLLPQRSITVGNRTFSPAEVTRLMSNSLAAGGGGIFYGIVTTADRYATLKNHAGTSIQVGASTKLVIHAIEYTSAISSSFSGTKPSYGDNDVGFDSSSAPTNEVSVASYESTAVYMGVVQSTGNSPQGVGMGFGLYFEVPATKYPAVGFDNANSVAKCYCLIEAA